MNQIIQKQSEDRSLHLLAAFRQHYSDEKRWMAIWLFVVTVVAIAGSGAVPLLNANQYSIYFILLSIFIVSIELWVLPWIVKLRYNAASIQEVYDCELFGLRWNLFLTLKPQQDTINSAAKRHLVKLSEQDIEQLRNWYTSQAADWPQHQARIICQWQNTWWNQELRREYYRLLLIGTTIISLLVFVIFQDWTIETFISGPLLLFLPLILLGFTQANMHRQIVARLETMRSAIDNLWDQIAKDEITMDQVELQTRDLQNEIYHIRKNGPPIPDWYYNLRLKHFEKLSNTPGQLPGTS